MLCYHGGRVVIFLNETTPPSSCCVSVPGWSGIDCNGTIALPPRGLSPVDSHRLATPWWATPVMSKQHLLFLCTTDVHQLLFMTPTPFLTPFLPTNYPLFTDLSYDRLMRPYNCHMVSDFLAPICCCPCCRSCPPPPTPTSSLYWCPSRFTDNLPTQSYILVCILISNISHPILLICHLSLQVKWRPHICG